LKKPYRKADNVLENLLKKRIFWILFGLALIGTLLLVAMPIGMDYGIERYFITHGAYQTDLEDVDFNPFTRRLVIKNLTVNVGNENVLTIAKAGFKFSWSPLFKKRLLIQELDLSDSDIEIEELPDGSWRIAGLLPRPSADPSSASSWGFGLVNVQVYNSRVKFRSMQLTSELKVEQARLTRLRTWLPDQKARLEFEGQLNDGKLQVQGDFSPFSSGTTFDGEFKLQGLTLTPFAQLIAADPGTLKGQLDGDVRIHSKYSSEKGFNFDQTGRLSLKQTRMRFADVDLADQNIAWDGTVQVKLPSTSDALLIAFTGQLKGTGGFINPTPDKLGFQHKGLGWNGKFVLDRKTQTDDYTIDGALALQDFKMAIPEINLTEESLSWDGNVQITLPGSPGVPFIAAAGQLVGKVASLSMPSANFKLQGNGLNYSGEFAFASEKETADIKLNGDLKFGKLEVASAEAHVAEEDLTWGGKFQISLPENKAAQHLTTNGKLGARSQTITMLGENLRLANENLAWEGRFDFGLQDVTAGLAVEGNFSLTDLVITDSQKELRLLASKAVSLKSIKGDAKTQFSIASAKITGLDLVGKTGSPEKPSLLSAAEVQADTVKLEQLKQVSIESARIAAAKGVLHQKKDGSWRYIEDLTTFLADTGASKQKEKSQNRAVEKAPHPAKVDGVDFGIRIGSLEIVGDSVLQFKDETVNPAFVTEARLTKALLTGVNSFKPDQFSPFTLEASSRKYTRIKLQGNVQPFGERISMDFKGKFRALEMPPLSAYAVKTIGYNLTSGEMDADIDLKITVGMLEGEGNLKFKNLIVEAVNPEKLENAAGTPIPLQSALKVLRDKDNDVRLKTPISGDVNDPQFSIADTINQAVIKGLTVTTLSYLKYMLGPYGTAIAIVELGAKVGAKTLTRIKLNPVKFQPGTSDLDATGKEYMDKLAAIMKQKKDLRLRLCGWATESDRMGSNKATARTTGASSPAESPDTKSTADGQSSAQKNARFPLSEEVMLALAEQRADLIEEILVSRHGIQDDRIFICKPEIDKNPEAKPRVDLVF
jgi:hypothetical protein